MKRFIVILTLAVMALLGFYLFYREGSLPVNKEDNTAQIFVIKPGDSLNLIANHLAQNGLIRNKAVFYLIVKRLGYEKKIQAGDFRLTPSMNAEQVAKLLTHGTLDIWVTLIEGTRKEEIAQILSRDLDIPETEFLKEAKEGYLYPDTYLIQKNATAGAVLEVLYKTFSERYTGRLRQLARVKGLSDEDVVTLASIVEREASRPADREGVASVLLKRLKNDWPLQSDITVAYALGYQADIKSWWKPELTFDDIKIDSPYNTYVNKGLPPTPVSNPGITSIEAVVNADPNTPYYFYISDKQGNMHYARTSEEHEANIKKYLQ